MNFGLYKGQPVPFHTVAEWAVAESLGEGYFLRVMFTGERPHGVSRMKPGETVNWYWPHGYEWSDWTSNQLNRASAYDSVTLEIDKISND